jgi:hypothetical protein
LPSNCLGPQAMARKHDVTGLVIKLRQLLWGQPTCIWRRDVSRCCAGLHRTDDARLSARYCPALWRRVDDVAQMHAPSGRIKPTITSANTPTPSFDGAVDLGKRELECGIAHEQSVVLSRIGRPVMDGLRDSVRPHPD